MNSVIRNVLAVIAGFAFGSVVNIGIIMISGSIIPPPEGADVTSVKGLEASIHLFQPKHFIFPFLAHALGTFTGGVLAAIIAVSHKLKFSLGIGVIFLAGGVANILMLPSPLWFTILDLVGAYIPMGYFAGKLVVRK